MPGNDNNELGYVIRAVDETAAGADSAKKNFKSLEQQVTQSAQKMNSGISGAEVSFSQATNNASAAAIRRIEQLEARAAQAGRSVLQNLYYQKATSNKALEGDTEAVKRNTAAYDGLIAARKRYEAEASRRKVSSTLASLEAEVAGSTGSELERVLARRASTLARLTSQGAGTAEIKTAESLFAKLAEEAKKESGGTLNTRRVFLGLKDLSEGYTRGAGIELADVLVGTGGQGGLLRGSAGRIAEITGLTTPAVIGITSLAAAFLGLEFAGFKSSRAIAELGENITNTSLKTGIRTDRVQAFQFAASASGASPDILERLSRGLSETANDNSATGARGRKELAKLGVNLRDQYGDLKPTEDILLEISDAINKLPPGLQASAASIEIFKRAGIDAIPFLRELRENLATSDLIGHTFSAEEIEKFAAYRKEIEAVSAEFGRLKLQGEAALAGIYIKTAQSVSLMGDLFTALKLIVDHQVGKVADQIVDEDQTPPNIKQLLSSTQDKKLREKLLLPTGEQGQKTGQIVYAQTLLDRFRASIGIQGDIEQLRKESAGALDIKEVGDPEKTIAAVTAYQQLQERETALKNRQQSSEDQIALYKESLALKSQIAQVDEESALKEIRANTSKNAGVESEIDLQKELGLVRARVERETEQAIGNRRYRVDDKTGARIDLSGTAGFQQFAAGERGLEPARIELESKRVIDTYNEAFTKKQTSDRDAIFKGSQEAQRQQQAAERTYNEAVSREQKQAAEQYYRDQATEIDRERTLALQSLDVIDAQTLQQKEALEERKLAIEETFTARSLQNQLARIESERTREEGELEGKARASNTYGSEGYNADLAAVDARYDAQRDSATRSAYSKELELAQATANQKAKLEMESNRQVYSELQKESRGFVDALFSKNPGDSLKNWAKNLFEGLGKEILSNQIAATLTGAITGSNVSFNPLSAGGRFGDVLGRLGLGSPRFDNINKLNQPNHLGDVNLIGGAVPVVLQGVKGQTSAPASRSFSFPSLGGLFGGSTSGESVSSSISYAGGGTDFGPGTSSIVSDGLGGLLPGAPAFAALAPLLGAPGGTSGFAGPLSGGGGILGSLTRGGGGILSNLGGLFGAGSSGTDLGNGVGIANSGVLGRLAAFGKSNAAGTIGTTLALDGLRRGGLAGTLETTGGGALLGFKYGGSLGPVGALIGAGIGAVAGIIRNLIGDDRGHTKDLVKQIYGISINNATADQIIQIAKQSYGGQISVAVRSPEVRNLLKLYAQTLSPNNQAQFVADQVHGASLVEAGGQLQQRAVYDNGSAYSYSSPLATYGGVQTTLLPTAAPNNGVSIGALTLSVNGQSASNLLAGQVANVATPGFIQAQSVAGANASIGRNSQQSLNLQPSAISR